MANPASNGLGAPTRNSVVSSKASNQNPASVLASLVRQLATSITGVVDIAGSALAAAQVGSVAFVAGGTLTRGGAAVPVGNQYVTLGPAGLAVVAQPTILFTPTATPDPDVPAATVTLF